MVRTSFQSRGSMRGMFREDDSVAFNVMPLKTFEIQVTPGKETPLKKHGSMRYAYYVCSRSLNYVH